MNDETTERNREREDREGRALRTAQAWVFGLGAGALVLVLLVFAFMIGYNRGQDEAEGGAEQAMERPQAEEEQAPAPGGPGEDLFVEQCGSCHVLAAAGTSGTIGPDLDGLSPDEQQVLAAIENGGTGSGAMPAGLLEGKDAQAVAEYVATAAGQ